MRRAMRLALPLRRRLVLATLVVTAVVGGSIAVLMVILRSSLQEELDKQLLAATQTLVACRNELRNGPNDPTVSSVVTDRSAAAACGALGGDGAVRLPPPPRLSRALVDAHATTSSSRLAPFTVTVDGRSYRVAAVRMDDGHVLTAAVSTDHIDATFRRVGMGAVAAGLTLVVVVAVLAWWIERLGLRPIRQVAATAEAIASGDAARRVSPPPPGTEAGDLARAFNVMVDQRQAIEDRLRRFVADASHELRTPLTTITGVHQLVLSGALEGVEQDDAMRRASAEADRMTRLVEDLLALTQLDYDRPLASDRVDLGRLVTDAAADVALLQPSRSVQVSVVPPGGVVVRGDESRLRQVIGNLVGNALTHTPSDATLALAVVGSAADVVVEVQDDGPGLAPEQAAQVFERFYRVAPGLSRQRGGSGLGLSIVRSIVEAHGGSVSLTTAPGAGCIFRVALPGNLQVP